MPGALPLGPVDLAIASVMVVVAALVSLGLRLGMERTLAVAAVRTVVQLLLVGLVLRWVFEVERLDLFAAIVAMMVLAAAYSAVARSSRQLPWVRLDAFVTLVLVGVTTTVSVTSAIVGVEPFWRPQYALPLLGMVLGNGLTGISIALDSLLETLDDGRARIETELALGANRWEAAREPLRDAVRRGMIPIVNSMMVVGLVSLPGMMTGQILAGADPFEAVKYQVVVMFMIAAATTLGCTMMALLIYRRLFNERHQLRAERIERR